MSYTKYTNPHVAAVQPAMIGGEGVRKEMHLENIQIGLRFGELSNDGLMIPTD